MKTEALTLRLSASLANSLRKIAKQKGVPKSQVVREAVAKYLSPPAGDSPVREVSARALAASWKTIPRLSPDEATDLGREIAGAREGLVLPPSPWE